MFFSVITKNLNWEILTINLVTFKIWDRIKDKKFWCYGGSLKNLIFKGERFTKNQYIEGNCLKWRAWTLANLREVGRVRRVCGKKGEVVFLRRVVDTPMHTMMTKNFCQFSLKCLLKYFVQRFVDKFLQKHLSSISSELLLY